MAMIRSVPAEETEAPKVAATYLGHTVIHPWPSAWITFLPGITLLIFRVRKLTPKGKVPPLTAS